MNLLHLQYFCEIAREENISRTAEKLSIAQSALSKALSSLEADLGVRLFDRVGKYIRLNDEGRLLYEQCSYAISLINDAENRIRHRDECQEGKIVVCADSLHPYLPGLIQQFHVRYPQISLKLADTYDSTVLRTRGEFDVSICDRIIGNREEQSAVLFRDEMVLMLPKSHPLAQAGEVDLTQLANEFFIYCCRPGDMLNLAYDSLCCLAGFVPKIFLVGADLSITISSVHSGNAVAFIPASAIAVMPRVILDTVAMVKIRNPYYASPIYIATPCGKVRSAAAQLFIDFLQEYFSSIYKDGVCSLEEGLSLAKNTPSQPIDFLLPIPDIL